MEQSYVIPYTDSHIYPVTVCCAGCNTVYPRSTSHGVLLQAKYLLSDVEIGPNISKVDVSLTQDRKYKQI